LHIPCWFSNTLLHLYRSISNRATVKKKPGICLQFCCHRKIPLFVLCADSNGQPRSSQKWLCNSRASRLPS
jgi:ribosomal protein L34E